MSYDAPPMPALPQAPRDFGDDRLRLMIPEFNRPEPVVHFYLHAKRDEDASEAAKMPVYTEIPYFSIRIPDDPHSLVSRPPTEDDKRRYAVQWNAFANRGTELIPLRALRMGPARYAELAERGVQSVEALAAYTGDLPPNLDTYRAAAKRVLTALKPRLSVIDGTLKEMP